MVSNGLLRVDFGEIYVGYPRLAAKGPKGSAVEISEIARSLGRAKGEFKKGLLEGDKADSAD